MVDAFALGQAFMLAIRETKQRAIQKKKQLDLREEKQSSGSKWTWEQYVDGPLSDSDVDTITRLAGCWCYDNKVSQVRFYTNQNHERWR